MCAPCGAGESNCPACRALQPATGFAFDERATLEQQLSHALAAYQREWKSCAVAAALYIAVLVGGSVVMGIFGSLVGMAVMRLLDEAKTWSPFLLPAFTMVRNLLLIPVQSFAALGLMRMMLDVLMGRSPTASRFFSDTRLLPAAMAIQLPFTLVLASPSLATSALMTAAPEVAPFASVGFSVVFLVAFLFFGLGWWLFSVPELLISDCGALEAMRRALTLGRPWRNLRILGYTALAGLITLSGILACGVGALAALPFASLVVLSLFLALRHSSQLPAPTSL
jgi:hypothetical protein